MTRPHRAQGLLDVQVEHADDDLVLVPGDRVADEPDSTNLQTGSRADDEPCYTGRAQLRQAYTKAWASPSVALDTITDLAVHDTADPAVIVDEWRATGTTRDGSPVDLAGVLVLEARNGLLVWVRDYMDVFGLASQLGCLDRSVCRLLLVRPAGDRGASHADARRGRPRIDLASRRPSD